MPANEYVYMNVAPINYGDRKRIVYEYEESLAAPGNGKAVLIPDGVEWWTTTMSFTGGAEGKVQLSTDSVDTIKTGTVTWVDSWWGDADDTYIDFYFLVTAFRMVQTVAGTMKLTARAQ